MLPFRIEVIVYYVLIEGFFEAIGNKRWTSVFEGEVIQADWPAGIAVVNVHQVLLELLHGLGKQSCRCLVLLRFVRGALVILGQAVVQLKIADEL